MERFSSQLAVFAPAKIVPFYFGGWELEVSVICMAEILHNALLAGLNPAWEGNLRSRSPPPLREGAFRICRRHFLPCSVCMAKTAAAGGASRLSRPPCAVLKWPRFHSASTPLLFRFGFLFLDLVQIRERKADSEMKFTQTGKIPPSLPQRLSISSGLPLFSEIFRFRTGLSKTGGSPAQAGFCPARKIQRPAADCAGHCASVNISACAALRRM